ncbi:hypothetical protein FN846DRAFT_953327 [Sphaerosporella brunnea]|uniref:Uncharacterized protein n=1 Tax=Sphaerosporella brunnea TaxID=1250544 RepID=A0A5J5EU08_9PEZI|nr:hypothetical protein FN846DRAFT_953327 [Sphaerosporella brunnea]
MLLFSLPPPPFPFLPATLLCFPLFHGGMADPSLRLSSQGRVRPSAPGPAATHRRTDEPVPQKYRLFLANKAVPTAYLWRGVGGRSLQRSLNSSYRGVSSVFGWFSPMQGTRERAGRYFRIREHVARCSTAMEPENIAAVFSYCRNLTTGYRRWLACVSTRSFSLAAFNGGGD